MRRDEIAAVTAAFGAAAKRMRAAALDGMEISLAHGHLLHQFLSASFNRRTDDFGGSAENRARFPRQVLEAVADLCVVGVRVSADEFLPNGMRSGEQYMRQTREARSRADCDRRKSHVDAD